MDSQPKMASAYQGHTEVPEGNPPPYSGPSQPGYYPHPHTVQPTPVHVHYPGAGGQPMIVTPAVIVTRQLLGPSPTHMTCKSCNAEIVTRVEGKPTVRTHLCALALCLLFWPLVCLPYCMDSCMNANHYCPNCNAYIGTYQS